MQGNVFLTALCYNHFYMYSLLISDIFGRTSALEKLAADICSSCEAQIEILDPYEGNKQEFQTEDDAYQAFTSTVGMNAYVNKVESKIKALPEKVSVIGFSVGASALWRLSEQNVAEKIASAVLFYGSQIRNFTEVEPKIPTRLIFPRFEAHFDVNGLISKLKQKKNVELEHTEFLHGFMNPHSRNFDQAAYHRYFKTLLEH